MKPPPPKEPKFDKAGSETVRSPIYVAATSPFTLVTFDHEEKPSFTLEEVNCRSYDRLKLCRTTTGLNPLISAMDRMAVIVSYTGAMLYPRMQNVSEDDVVDSANRLLLKMTFGGIDFDAVTRNEVGFGFIYGTGYFLAVGNAGGPNFNTLVALQHQDVSSFDAIRLTTPRVLTSSEVHAAVRAGTPVVDGLPEMSPSLFLNGLTYFRQGELAPALVFLWSTCEGLIGRLWDDHVVPKGSGIPGRKRFVEGSGWQAAHMVEVLFQMNLIGDELYTQLSRARAARNALAHRAISPKVDDCKDALKSAFELVSVVRSGGTENNEFKHLADRFASAHDPNNGPQNPLYWREIPSVPGDEKWEGDYPRHPEIELVPFANITRVGDRC